MNDRTLHALADRDSVCAGDDVEPHGAAFGAGADQRIDEFLHAAQQACPLARIEGGRATWLIDTAGEGEGCIGVIAQQWSRPKLLIAESTTVGTWFGACTPSVHFRYWCQADPDAVFDALQRGLPLPSRYTG